MFIMPQEWLDSGTVLLPIITQIHIHSIELSLSITSPILLTPLPTKLPTLISKFSKTINASFLETYLFPCLGLFKNAPNLTSEWFQFLLSTEDK